MSYVSSNSLSDVQTSENLHEVMLVSVNDTIFAASLIPLK